MGIRAQKFQEAEGYLKAATEASQRTVSDYEYRRAVSSFNEALALDPKDRADRAISNAKINSKIVEACEGILDGRDLLEGVNPSLKILWSREAILNGVMADEKVEPEFEISAYKGLTDTPGLTYRSMSLLGDYAVKKGQHEKAIEHYQAAWELREKMMPEGQAKLQDKLGGVYEVQKNLPEAAKCFHQAFQLEKTKERVGKLVNILGQLEQGAPIEKQIRESLVQYYLQQGNAKRTDAKVKTGPIGEVPEFRDKQGRNISGELYTIPAANYKKDFWNGKKTEYANGINQYQEALSSYEQVLKLDPKNKNALEGKAEACVALGEYKEALTCYEEKEENQGDARRRYLEFLIKAKALYNSAETDPVSVKEVKAAATDADEDEKRQVRQARAQALTEAKAASEAALQKIVFDQLQPLLNKIDENSPERKEAETALENFQVLVRGKAHFFYYLLGVVSSSDSRDAVYQKNASIGHRGEPLFYEMRKAWDCAAIWNRGENYLSRESLENISAEDDYFYHHQAQVVLKGLPPAPQQKEKEEKQEAQQPSVTQQKKGRTKEEGSPVFPWGRAVNFVGRLTYAGSWGAVGVYIAAISGMAVTPLLILPALGAMALGAFLMRMNPQNRVGDQSILRGSISTTVFAAVSLTIAALAFGLNPFSLIALAAVGAGVVFGALVYAAARVISDKWEAHQAEKMIKGDGASKGDGKDNFGARDATTPKPGIGDMTQEIAKASEQASTSSPSTGTSKTSSTSGDQPPPTDGADSRAEP